MPTINMEPLLKEILIPTLLKVIAPTIVLLIVFSVIKILVLRSIEDRKTKNVIRILLNIIFLVAFGIIGIPATQAVIGSVNFRDYVVPDEVVSNVSIPEASSWSSKDYFAPFFEACEREWAKQEEMQNDEKTEDERYDEYKKAAEEVWNSKHPDQNWDEDEYQEFLEEIEKLWDERYGKSEDD